MQASQVKDVPSSPSSARAFVENYLSVAQRSDLDSIEYPQTVMPKTNMGVSSGLDLDNNGEVDETPGDRTYGNDAYGFGEFLDQYGASFDRDDLPEGEARFVVREDDVTTVVQGNAEKVEQRFKEQPAALDMTIEEYEATIDEYPMPDPLDDGPV